MTVNPQPISTIDSNGVNGRPSSTMLILVGGLPGSGKTYFASRLSARLQATYISSDLMRKQMEAQGRYAFEDKLNVYEHMACSAATALRQKHPVVVDGTFYCKPMREIFFTLAKLMHLKHAFIEIIADEDVIKKRLDQGMASHAANLSVYRLVKSQWEEPDATYLVVESKDGNIEEMITMAMQYVSALKASP